MKMFFSRTGHLMWVLGILVLSILSPCASFGKSSPEKTQEYEDGQRKFAKFFNEALFQKSVGNKSGEYELLQRALTHNPNSATALIELAELQAENPQIDSETINQNFCRALVLDSSNAYHRWVYVKYAVMTNQTETAITHLNRLVKDKEIKEDAYSLLVKIYERMGKDSLLLQTIEQWESNDGGNEEISIMKIDAYNRLHLFDKSIALMDTLIKNSPQNDYYYTLLSNTYLYQNDTTSARKTLEKAEKLFPGSTTIEYYWIAYYMTTGQKNKLNAQVEMVLLNPKQSNKIKNDLMRTFIKNNADGPDAWRIDTLANNLLALPLEDATLLNIYVSHLLQKNVPGSQILPFIHKILEIEPANSQMRAREVWTLFVDNRFEETLLSCEEGIKHTPQLLLQYFAAGSSCSRLGNKTKAAEYYKQGTVYSKENPDKMFVSDYFSSYADILQELGQIKESYANYDSSLVYNPENPNTLNNYAYFLAKNKEELDRAETMAAKAIKFVPDNSSYLDTYAWIFFQKKDYEKAKSYIESALEHMDAEATDTSIFDHAGDIYFHLGNSAKALEYWKKAQSKGDKSSLLKKKIQHKKYFE